MKSTSAAILVLFILLLISGSFAATTYGPSRITIERTWTIDNVKDNDISFLAALAVNDSNQKIIHINVSPGVTTFQDGNDTVWLNYSGHMNKKTKVITASVMLDIYYDTQLVSDESVATSRVAYTPLTQADDGIIFQAELLNQQNSSLQTIANLANWINDNMEYDISYWGKVVPAETVFQTRKGVCVEHTHLFMSLANSLGFKTRYASGYVYANGWQPHAWTEVYVPSYGWLSVDPTLAQVGTLDNSHVLLRYGADQNSVFDSLISQNADATLSFDDSITTIFSSETPVPPSMSLSFDESSYIVFVNLSNPSSEYIYGTYSFLPPVGYADPVDTIILLHPQEKLSNAYQLDQSFFVPGYYYVIPISTSFNDLEIQQSHNISVVEDNGFGDFGQMDPSGLPLQCQTVFILFAVCIISCFYKTR